jgi:cytochrome c-type biogenesis protein CcmE
VDPARKRKIRLVVALSAAVLLAVGLIYTSFSASTEAKQPSEILHASSDDSYDLTGVVVPGSITHSGSELGFRVADRDDPNVSIPVRYSGEVPDPFRDGREVIVTGTVDDGTFLADRDSLVTKCPSKFQTEAEQDPEHVIIK